MGEILHDVPVKWGDIQVGVAEVQGNEILITLSASAGENISHGILVGMIHGLNLKPIYSKLQPMLAGFDPFTAEADDIKVTDD